MEQKLLASGFSTRYDEAGNLYGYLDGEGTPSCSTPTWIRWIGRRLAVVEDGSSEAMEPPPSGG